MAYNPVKTYYLSEEELAHYRNLPLPEATPRQIENYKRQQAISRAQNREREKRLSYLQSEM